VKVAVARGPVRVGGDVGGSGAIAEKRSLPAHTHTCFLAGQCSTRWRARCIRVVRYIPSSSSALYRTRPETPYPVFSTNTAKKTLPVHSNRIRRIIVIKRLLLRSRCNDVKYIFLLRSNIILYGGDNNFSAFYLYR